MGVGVGVGVCAAVVFSFRESRLQKNYPTCMKLPHLSGGVPLNHCIQPQGEEVRCVRSCEHM